MLITLYDNCFELLADRAVFWQQQKLLMVADTHFGKDSIFRREGLAVPAGNDQNTFDRLDRLIANTQCQHLVILGDFIHGKLSASHGFYRHYQQWRSRHNGMEITLTVGNHDRYLDRDQLPATGCIEKLWIEKFCLCHEADNDKVLPDSKRFVIAGHIHPCYRLRNGKQALRLPVFWLQQQSLILPAFSEFTGGLTIEPGHGDRCFAATEDRVIELPM